MNIYSIIILSALALDFVLNLIADSLNLKALDSGLPDEFKDLYDEETYDKSQAYTKVQTRFGIITSTF